MKRISAQKLQVLQLVSKAMAENRAGNTRQYDITYRELRRLLEALQPEERESLVPLVATLNEVHGRAVPDADVAQLPEAPDPIIAIVTPVLNCVTHIDDTISSLAMQRGKFALHYHVQDAGSTDGTLEKIRAWEIQLQEGILPGLPPVKFTWDSAPDLGMYDAIAVAFSRILQRIPADHAHHTFMTWVNADDMIPLNTLRTVTQFFGEHPEFNWLTGMVGLLDAAGAAVDVPRVRSFYSQHDLASGRHDGRLLPFLPQEGTFWRRTLWDTAGGVDRSFRLAGDWDLWRRFASLTPPITLSALLGLHRRRPGQLSVELAPYFREVDAALGNIDTPEGLRRSGFAAAYDPEVRRWNAIELQDPETQALESSGAISAPPLPQALPPAAGRSTDMPSRMADTAATRRPERLPSGRPWPRISVVTPSFNQGRFIGETLESVLSQGYPDLEYIVIDGGSTDETRQVVAPYLDRIRHFVSEADDGQSDALNKGFGLATGDILCWLNSDDQYAPGALHAVALAFDRYDVDMASGMCEVYSDGKLVHRHMSACRDGPLPLQDLLDLDTGWNAGQFFYQPEVFFTRSLWERAGSHVRVDCHYSMDYELWCRFALAKARLHVIATPLAKFRQHPEQKTADPEKFKAELRIVRDAFLKRHAIDLAKSRRAAVRWERRLRVAMLNDLGGNYGAGIAHGRVAASLDMAGHDVEWFVLRDYASGNNRRGTEGIIADIQAFAPDVVIVGNLHAVARESAGVVGQLSARFPTFWIAHDFWPITGRCAYMGDCSRYLTGCDASCPTADEYPALAATKILAAWTEKRHLLAGPNAPVLLANSDWTFRIFDSQSEFANLPERTRIRRIRLGAPTDLFAPGDRVEARLALGIAQDAFVLAFSASSVSDARKGSHHLMEALACLSLPRLVLLIIGNPDREIKVAGADVVPLGYVTDPAILVSALRASDVYVGPSTAETFGQVFIEAAMCAVPSIGFDQTGVRDAIAQDTSGLLVPQRPGSLAEAIQRIHDDHALRSHLRAWAPVYAASEYSLEACYRSLFLAFDEEGLLDRWELPHKIGFQRTSRFIPASSGRVPVWQPVQGMSGPEGPYPEDKLERVFQWCHGEKTTLRINCRAGGPVMAVLHYYNSLFPGLEVTVLHGGDYCGTLCLDVTHGPDPRQSSILIEAKPGWNSLNLLPSQRRPSDGREARELSFMLVEVDIVSPRHATSPGQVQAPC